jgi:hypothetical protein
MRIQKIVKFGELKNKKGGRKERGGRRERGRRREGGESGGIVFRVQPRGVPSPVCLVIP